MLVKLYQVRFPLICMKQHKIHSVTCFTVHCLLCDVVDVEVITACLLGHLLRTRVVRAPAAAHLPLPVTGNRP